MPCFDCIHWQRPELYEPRQRHARGWCRHDNRASHGGYHCGSWRQRAVLHAEVGLTPVEVAWARRNPGNPHIVALNTLFRRIEGLPNDDKLRQEFAERLEMWRANRANSGEALVGSAE